MSGATKDDQPQHEGFGPHRSGSVQSVGSSIPLPRGQRAADCGKSVHAAERSPDESPNILDEYDFNEQPPCGEEYLGTVLPRHVNNAIAIRAATENQGIGRTVKGRGIEPTQCVFWSNPERIRERSIRDKFEIQESYVDDEHWRRQLLRCRECGQLYFYEMLEFVDYSHGEDPIYRKYIPIFSAGDAAALLNVSTSGLNGIVPCLRVDWPSESSEPAVFWKKRQ